ncbi:GNAT family N-acetyltransferase [Herbivorax sp. ANBcel31]|nr:GNAT family N-acetyltransferase [Herbivorax sp. ANBcel31]MDQ2088031.1 GNAT family N-acetyltransferase [Herbivorax sp. ANBcel31]
MEYREFKLGQENEVSNLVWEVFSEFEAPDYSDEGIRTFKDFIEPKELANTVSNSSAKICCCYEDNTIVGVLAFMNITHISLLFVKKLITKEELQKNY